ncbi:unnamed protein product [Microthlaspi erraticum]|uniref:Uncharacterized protein n=1 Tax=Microthlaspi erraticum TaxID=1685480 RepID=A0A6D2JJN1_9BRAS|nr:unnamed protein product [Microthlaspi erraticum]
MRESSHRPLIFGTPFLSTVGAIFDFPNQRISFNKVNKGMFFPMCSTKNSFVDMVQEEKATLKPPQEGETEETIKEDPIPKPKQLAKQARSKTKAPTPKPPKGSTKIEDEAKPRRKAVVPRDIHGEIVYPAVNHPPDTHCKEKRLGGSRCLLSHLLLSAKPYSQAKDLKQALHGRQPMRIEGEKGVKTQSAPKHWPRTRKRNFGRAISNLADRTVEPGRNSVLGRIDHRATKRSRARTNREEKAAIGRFCIGTDRPCRSIRETTRPRPKSLAKTNLADQIARPRQNPSAIGPKLF